MQKKYLDLEWILQTYGKRKLINSSIGSKKRMKTIVEMKYNIKVDKERMDTNNAMRKILMKGKNH